MSNEIQVYEGAPPPMLLSDVKAQVNLIQQIMREVMQEGEHYGIIPGTNKKSLLKPGSEKIIMTFRMVPDVDYDVIDLPNEHREYRVKVRLSAQNGIFLGTGVGSCSTMEGKYRFRKANQSCPECGRETIIKGKQEYGGGWLCFQRSGGCGSKFPDGDPRIENQNMGRVEHDNPADYYNTVLKMGKKRALSDAVLTVTAASDIFTQDLDDDDDLTNHPQGKPTEKKPPISHPKAKIQELKPEPATAKGKIEQVASKTGKGQKGEWTNFSVKIGGAWYGTFDLKIGEIANQYKGSEAVVSFTNDGKFNTIVELVPILEAE